MRVVAALFTLAFGFSMARAEEYNFRGAVMAMSIDDFRQIPHPDGLNTSDRTKSQVFCSGDAIPEPKTEEFYIAVYESEAKAAGLLKCSYFDYGIPPGPSEKIKWHLSSIEFGNVGSFRIYYFFTPDQVGVHRLSKIEIKVGKIYYDQVRSSIEAKWGKANLLTTKDVQNTLGNTFSDHIMIWSKPDSTIKFEEMSDDLRVSEVTYVSKSLSELFDKAVKKIGLGAVNKM